MRYVFVTGGAGYIGSHACLKLKQRGLIPVTLDNLSTGWNDAVKFGPLEKLDLLDREALRNCFSRYKPIAVMHFAALSHVGESIKEPIKYWSNNVIGSLNLIKETVAANCRHFVFSSTCATYGEHDGILINEQTPQKPINSYGASKLAVENMLIDVSKAQSLNYMIFRYFNVAGADPSGQIGELHIPETHLIPSAFDVISGKTKYIEVFGNDYPTRDGTCVRDYVHVVDLIVAHLLGLEKLLAGGKSGIFNLGTGSGFTVNEVLTAVEKCLDCQLPVIQVGRRRGDCASLVCGSRLAFKELGWHLSRSSLEDMIGDAWQWHQASNYRK